MKRTSLHLHIAEPCHEDWAKMLPEEKGRHCLACQKTVMDFTQLSDKEIIDFFATKPTSVCGRFRTDQMYPTVVEQTPPVPRWKLFLLALVATLPVKMLFSESLKAQTRTEQHPPDYKMGKIVAPLTFSVSGTILDAKTQKKLEGVPVHLQGSQRHVSTNTNGVFTISGVQNGDVLVVHIIGYNSQKVVVRSASQLTISLEQSKALPKEVVMGAVMEMPEVDSTQKK